jgi:hypothetical protein
MNRNEARKFAEIVQAYADGEDVRVRGRDHILQNPDFKLGYLSYEIVPKPKSIDLSVLMASGIDCEFSFKCNPEQKRIGKMTDISPARPDSYKKDNDVFYHYCRPRMNHIHFWGGGECPLPDGLEVELTFRDGSELQRCLSVVADWDHKFEGKDIVGFEVIGLEEGYCWPYDLEKNKC